MIYYINYELDNGYRIEDVAVIVNSRNPLNSDDDIKDFLYANVDKHSDDCVRRIYQIQALDSSNTSDRLYMRKVGIY